jgi:hypothetical protein
MPETVVKKMHPIPISVSHVRSDNFLSRIRALENLKSHVHKSSSFFFKKLVLCTVDADYRKFNLSICHYFK